MRKHGQNVRRAEREGGTRLVEHRVKVNLATLDIHISKKSIWRTHWIRFPSL